MILLIVLTILSVWMMAEGLTAGLFGHGICLGRPRLRGGSWTECKHKYARLACQERIRHLERLEFPDLPACDFWNPNTGEEYGFDEDEVNPDFVPKIWSAQAGKRHDPDKGFVHNMDDAITAARAKTHYGTSACGYKTPTKSYDLASDMGGSPGYYGASPVASGCSCGQCAASRVIERSAGRIALEDAQDNYLAAPNGYTKILSVDESTAMWLDEKGRLVGYLTCLEVPVSVGRDEPREIIHEAAPELPLTNNVAFDLTQASRRGASGWYSDDL